MDAVIAEATIRIEQSAERFGISLMTVHRDLDELEGRRDRVRAQGMNVVVAPRLEETSFTAASDS